MTARNAMVRHPISLGWMITPLITPHLTLGHVVFTATTLVYIILATPFEETDLIEALGEPYRDYRNRMRAFVPFSEKAPIDLGIGGLGSKTCLVVVVKFV